MNVEIQVGRSVILCHLSSVYTLQIKSMCSQNNPRVNQCDKNHPTSLRSFTLSLQNVAQNSSNKGKSLVCKVVDLSPAYYIQDVARRSVVKRVVDLQEESGNTGKTSEASETSDLGGSARDGGDHGGLGLLRGGRGGAGGLGNTRNLGNGGVLVGRAVVADDSAGGDHRLGDGARAVGDGEGGRGGHGVGLGAVGDLGGLRAVGDVDVNNLGDDGAVVGSHGASGGSSDDSSDGVLHLVGIKG